MAAKVNLSIDKGATYNLNLYWRDSAQNPIDIEDWQARMQCRPTPTSSEKILDLTSGSGITLGPSGHIEIEISDEITTSITKTVGFYDLELEDPDGKVKRLLEGKINFNYEITK